MKKIFSNKLAFILVILLFLCINLFAEDEHSNMNVTYEYQHYILDGYSNQDEEENNGSYDENIPPDNDNNSQNQISNDQNSSGNQTSSNNQTSSSNQNSSSNNSEPPAPVYPDPNEDMSDEELNVILVNGSPQQQETAQQIIDIREHNRENNHILAEAEMISEQAREVLSVVQEISAPPVEEEQIPLTGMQEEIELAQEDQQNKEEIILAQIPQNQQEIKNTEAVQNSEHKGDPVIISTGVYEQNENDIGFIQVDGFYITRNYLSDRSFSSSFGYGWMTNLDQKIIRGVDAGFEQKQQNLVEYSQNLKTIIQNYETELAASYGVSSIYEAPQVYSQKMQNCIDLLYQEQHYLDQSQALYNRSQGYEALEQVSELNQELMKIIASLEKRIQDYQKTLAAIQVHLQNIAAYRQNYDQSMVQQEQNIQNYEASKLCSIRNRLAMAGGLPSYYEETGMNTLNFVDDQGYPHLFSETQPGKWISENKKYIYIEESGQGFKLLQSDGIIKYFDAAGFIVKIVDRNSNQIVINRNSEEKIEYIKSSFGEQLNFEYSGSCISCISNARDSSEKVIYQYKNGRLEAVQDTQGDSVTMEYDHSNRLVKLHKCDGSSVIFSYGEITFDKKVLVTATTNEEGFTEHFFYDRQNRRTVYTDQDGNTTTVWYDEKHRTVRQEYPDGTIVNKKYAEQDKPSEVYENGDKTEYAYDEHGNIILALYSDGSKEQWAYDSFGLVTSYVDREGSHFDYLRDSKGNLTEYKAHGKTVSVQEYNSKGLMVKCVVYGQNPVITDYYYDSYGNLSSQITAGIKTEYKYDKRNRLKKVIMNETVLEEYFYNNHTTTQESLNGLKTVYKTNGRKDITEIIQTDLITNVVHKTRIEYDNRHLPVKVFAGDGKTEKLITSYLYTKAGNLKACIRHGCESWITKYDYENARVAQETVFVVKDFCDTSITEVLLERLLQTAGENKYTKKYDYNVQSSSDEKEEVAIHTEYFPDGSVKLQTDLYGQNLFYNYDNYGRIISIQSQNKNLWNFWDNYNRITKQIIGNYPEQESSIYYITYEYSPDGRRVTATEGGKYKIIYDYDAFGNVISKTDGNGNTISYEYDCRNYLVAQVDGYKNKTLYEYNAIGLVSKVTNPDGAETNYKYNCLGLIEEITDSCGIVYTAAYDKDGRLVKERNRGDSEKSYEYDKDGRIIKSLCGGEPVESYSYSKDKQTITVKDGNGKDYVYNYDSLDRLVKEINREGNVQRYFYDVAGQLKSQINFDGSQTGVEFSADRTNQIISYSDGSKNSFIYDAIGNITESKNNYDRTIYKYDKGARLIYQKNISTQEEVFYEYDSAGNRTRMYSSNTDTRYSYGKNNELLEIFDNKQKTGINLKYDTCGRETQRIFANGTNQNLFYDKAGRIILITQKSAYGELLWGEAYTYGPDGKRTATVDNKGQVTLYEYNNKGQLSVVFYPYSKELEENLKTQAQENCLPAMNSISENKFLTAAERSSLISLLDKMQYGLSSRLSNLQIFIKESFCYDNNGNRISKTNSYGTITYTYDSENHLLFSGANGRTGIKYTYDRNGNLLSQESEFKTSKYAYNSQNRLIYCEVSDNSTKTYTQTVYAYDAFGRRILVQDNNSTELRSLYDGFSFDVIKQGPVFTNGMFADSSEPGIHWSNTGKPTGDRYRYLDDDTNDGNRYYDIQDDSYKIGQSRYSAERTYLCVNGTTAAISSAQGIQYFSTDLLGSVRSVTDSNGLQKLNCSYDAFGSTVQGDLSGINEYGYLCNPYDQTSNFYNYGYRDYNPQTSLFTTTDPIRDGTNWFSYCNNDPVNFVDVDGLFYYSKDGQHSSKAIYNTTVYIVRENDGLGNEFNSSLFIKKRNASGTISISKVYSVGANCKEEYFDESKGYTTPDGVYYLTNNGTEICPLYKQSDGTSNSSSYKNVLSLRTYDQKLPLEQQNEINTGDRLFHSDEQYDVETEILTPYNKSNTPGGAGCIISHTQEEHDLMMSEIMRGVDRPEAITVKIQSLSNIGGCTK